jgi:vacuolar-type H+-ATPase subunit H
MDILHLIDRLEEMVVDARRLPVGGGAVIPRQRLLDLIDRMRVAVPREVYDARELVEKQEEILHKARDEAALMLAEARARLEERITDAAVVKAADERSKEIVAQAQARAEEMVRSAEEQSRGRLDDAQESARAQMHEADVYALKTLRRLETELDGFLTTVRKGIDTLDQRAADRPGG